MSKIERDRQILPGEWKTQAQAMAKVTTVRRNLPQFKFVYGKPWFPWDVNIQHGPADSSTGRGGGEEIHGLVAKIMVSTTSSPMHKDTNDTAMRDSSAHHLPVGSWCGCTKWINYSPVKLGGADLLRDVSHSPDKSLCAAVCFGLPWGLCSKTAGTALLLQPPWKSSERGLSPQPAPGTAAGTLNQGDD